MLKSLDQNNFNHSIWHNSKNFSQDKIKDFLKFMKTYCIFDLETTGLNPETDYIIEIAALRIKDNQIESQFSSFVGLPKDISNPESLLEQIRPITGISYEMIKNAPDWSIVDLEFRKFVTRPLFVGYNVTFDIKFLKRYSKLWTTVYYIDILEIVNEIFANKLTRFSQKHVLDYLDIQYSVAHRALADVENLWQIIQKLQESYGVNIYDYMKKFE